MPWAPAKPCAQPGCPALVKGASRCPRHRLPPPRKGAVWRRLRAEFLAANPACAWPGCGRPATEVDHVLARRFGGTDDWAQLQGLCRAHHGAKTVAQDGGFGHAPR
jgi:5-methylcytosine-specific restriction enzyme A